MKGSGWGPQAERTAGADGSRPPGHRSRVSQAPVAAGEPAPRPVLTRDQREELKQLVDAEKRRRLARAENQVRDRKRRRESWRSYYWRNREQILERKRLKRAA